MSEDLKIHIQHTHTLTFTAKEIMARRCHDRQTIQLDSNDLEVAIGNGRKYRQENVCKYRASLGYREGIRNVYNLGDTVTV